MNGCQGARAGGGGGGGGGRRGGGGSPLYPHHGNGGGVGGWSLGGLTMGGAGPSGGKPGESAEATGVPCKCGTAVAVRTYGMRTVQTCGSSSLTFVGARQRPGRLAVPYTTAPHARTSASLCRTPRTCLGSQHSPRSLLHPSPHLRRIPMVPLLAPPSPWSPLLPQQKYNRGRHAPQSYWRHVNMALMWTCLAISAVQFLAGIAGLFLLRGGDVSVPGGVQGGPGQQGKPAGDDEAHKAAQA